MRTRRQILLFSAIAILVVLILPTVASAASFPSLIPECALGKKDPSRNIYVQEKAPDLDCVKNILVNIAKIILALSGSVALVMFIYGGFLWMTSGGEPKKVEDGKKIMVGTVIGLIIIFSANLAITTIEKIVKGEFGAKTTQGK
mgnify:CR=1 FL=1